MFMGVLGAQKGLERLGFRVLGFGNSSGVGVDSCGLEGFGVERGMGSRSIVFKACGAPGFKDFKPTGGSFLN